MTLNLAETEHERGQTARAIALVRDVLPAVRNSADTAIIAGCLSNLAGYLAASDDLAGAIDAAREAIVVYAQEPEYYLVTTALEHVALVYASRGRLADAVRLVTYTEAPFRRSARTDSPPKRNRAIDSLLFSTKTWRRTSARAAARGAELSPEAAVALVLAR